MQWLTAKWKTKDKWQKRTLFDSVQAVGGMTFMAALVALGAYILFTETCLPPFERLLK